MATVFIPSQLQDLTDGVAQVQVEATRVAGAIAALEERFPGIKQRLCDGDELSSSLMVSVDDTMTSQGLLAEVNPDSEIHFLPAVAGG